MWSVFSASKMELDEWSGKKTIKTGQQARNLANHPSFAGSDMATGSSKFNVPSSKESVAATESSSSGSTTAGGDDVTSTMAINEGQFVRERSFESLVLEELTDEDSVSVAADNKGCGVWSCYGNHHHGYNRDAHLEHYLMRVKKARGKLRLQKKTEMSYKRKRNRATTSRNLDGSPSNEISQDYLQIEVVHKESPSRAAMQNAVELDENCSGESASKEEEEDAAADEYEESTEEVEPEEREEDDAECTYDNAVGKDKEVSDHLDQAFNVKERKITIMEVPKKTIKKIRDGIKSFGNALAIKTARILTKGTLRSFLITKRNLSILRRPSEGQVTSELITEIEDVSVNSSCFRHGKDKYYVPPSGETIDEEEYKEKDEEEKIPLFDSAKPSVSQPKNDLSNVIVDAGSSVACGQPGLQLRCENADNCFVDEKGAVEVEQISRKEKEKKEMEMPFLKEMLEELQKPDLTVVSLSATTMEVSEASESDCDDLNTLSTISSRNSMMYELFPSNSFSSLTGFKCHQMEQSAVAMGCVDSQGVVDLSPKAPTRMQQQRGRSLVRNTNKFRMEKWATSHRTCAQ